PRPPGAAPAPAPAPARGAPRGGARPRLKPSTHLRVRGVPGGAPLFYRGGNPGSPRGPTLLTLARSDTSRATRTPPGAGRSGPGLTRNVFFRVATEWRWSRPARSPSPTSL